MLHRASYQTDSFEQSRRETAIHSLARMDSPRAAKCLVKVLDDPFVHIRREAVLWMAREFQSKETIRALSRMGRTAGEPVVRQNVIRTLGSLKNEEGMNCIRQGLASGRPEIVLTSLRALRRMEPDEIPSEVSDLLSISHAEITAEAIRTIGDLGGDRFVEKVVHSYTSRSGKPLAESLLVLGKHRSGAHRETLRDHLESGNWKVRIMALRGLLAAVDKPEHRRTLLSEAEQLLEDDRWRVRAATVDVLVRLWHPDVIPLLITGLEEAEGRLTVDYTRALQTLSGQPYGSNPLSWKSWWEKNREQIRLGSRPDNWRMGVRGKQSKEGSRALFFDIPIHSKRVMFVMDFSGGMDDPASRDGQETRRKIDIAREELKKTISEFRDTQRYNILVYRYYSGYPPREQVETAFSNRRLLPAHPKTRDRAGEWLDGREPLGWGAFWEGWMAGMKNEAVDTIVFLSDGVPTRGKHAMRSAVGRSPFLKDLRETFRYRQVMIHTVLTGTYGTDASLLEKVARTTGGFHSKTE